MADLFYHRVTNETFHIYNIAKNDTSMTNLTETDPNNLLMWTSFISCDKAMFVNGTNLH